MTWSLKIDEAPIGEIWGATKNGKVRHAYRFARGARWHGIQVGDQLIAWQPYAPPVHPHHMEVTSQSDDTPEQIPIVDGVGGTEHE